MSTSFSPGSLLGGSYRIEHEIGRGGMATVYLARDERHPRQVAVKVLSSGVSGSLDAERFLDEIRHTARLAHPHILALIDSGQEGGIPFYVTPFVRGESLGDRLKREQSLSVQDALRIGSALAAALAHAHAAGVIHRDVKPANILLDRDGNPYLADFGIARAVEEADTRHTIPGRVVGTPQYTSPEQVDDAPELDGRADVYSLCCVLFEMLTGAPPFTAASTSALMAAHLWKAPPSLREMRADVPPALDDLIRAGLSKKPAERVQTAAELAARLEELRLHVKHGRGIGSSWSSLVRTLGSSAPRVALAASAALFVGVVGLRLADVLPLPGASADPLDTTRYAVLPFTRDSTLADVVPAEALLEAALGEWEGITVVDGFQLEDLIDDFPEPQRLTAAEVRDIAAAVNAGRVVSGHMFAAGDSVRVEAALRDPTSPDQPLGRVQYVIGRDALAGDSLVAAGVELLLFGQLSPVLMSRTPGTRSVPARRGFVAGQDALAEWDLVAAEDFFSVAAAADPYFDLALLWKAQVMNWRGRLNQEWAQGARRAERSAGSLPPRELALVTALVALADGRHPAACQSYASLAARDSLDFAALYGLGECRSDDPVVVRDTASRTGWSFRASAHAAANEYRKAFLRLPASYRAFGAGSSDLLGVLLYARRGIIRRGRGAEPGSPAFAGFLEWQGDTLSFVAVPLDSLPEFEPDIQAEAEALAHQRRSLLDVTNAWAYAFPESGSALYSLAVAQELVGDPGALTSYREARRLARDPSTGLRAGQSEVLLAVRLLLPDDLEGLRSAVVLGDSLLRGHWRGDRSSPNRLVDIAVLLGRPSEAARLIRDVEVGAGVGNLPPEVRREGGALLAFAALGGPVDSLRNLEARVERLIQMTVPSGQRRQARQNVLELPSVLAYPHHRLQFLDSISLTRAPEAKAIATLAIGEVEQAVELLPESAAGWDILAARANIMVAAGLHSSALGLLRQRLQMLSAADPAEVSGAARIGGLTRAIVIRAALEAQLGSRLESERWARALGQLWASGESHALAVLSELRASLDEPSRQ